MPNLQIKMRAKMILHMTSIEYFYDVHLYVIFKILIHFFMYIFIILFETVQTHRFVRFRSKILESMIRTKAVPVHVIHMGWRGTAHPGP